MLDDATIDRIANDLEVYGNEFINNLTGSDTLKEASIAVQDAVMTSLANAGYDTSAKFILAIVSRSKVVAKHSGERIEFVYKLDFNPVDIKTEWTNKDGTTPPPAIINSIALASMIDVGRKAHTIVGKNTEHGMLAIPPAGEEYDPNNKANTIVGKAQVKQESPANYVKNAKLALDAWAEKKQKQIVDDFQAGVLAIIKRNVAI